MRKSNGGETNERGIRGILHVCVRTIYFSLISSVKTKRAMNGCSKEEKCKPNETTTGSAEMRRAERQAQEDGGQVEQRSMPEAKRQGGQWIRVNDVTYINEWCSYGSRDWDDNEYQCRAKVNKNGGTTGTAKK